MKEERSIDIQQLLDENWSLEVLRPQRVQWLLESEAPLSLSPKYPPPPPLPAVKLDLLSNFFLSYDELLCVYVGDSNMVFGTQNRYHALILPTMSGRPKKIGYVTN